MAQGHCIMGFLTVLPTLDCQDIEKYRNQRS